MARWACTDDLNNYFRKKDLLGGLTEMELLLVRLNLGIGLEEDGDGYLEITYLELTNRIKNSLLVPGCRYIISDYLTIYLSNLKIGNTFLTWGSDTNTSPIMPLLVQAISPKLLDPRAIALERPDWTICYDVLQKIFNDGKANKGTITYLRDLNNNAAFYDFKNVKFNREGQLYYTFNYSLNGLIKDASEIQDTHDNILGEGCWNNVFFGDTYYNIFHPDCTNNTFYLGCHNNIIHWSSVNNIFNETVCYTEGSMYNLNVHTGDTTLATAITKTIHKSNDRTLAVYLDPITYSLQFSILQ